MNARLILAAFFVSATSAGAAELKVTRVALFNSGVGYFECATSVDGNADAELKFRVAQINDILKSLVLRDLDGGTISTVQYASRDPVEKALKSFGVDITNRPTLGQLLDQLRGVSVEVQSPAPVRGLIVGVERRTTKTELGTIERDVLTIMTDTGLRSFVLADIAGIRIADTKIQDELTKALQTLAASHDADKKSVVLNFVGQGKRRVAVSYLLETPVWKTSYRLVLSDQKKPYLQGWAIVENATEQDWEDVRLSLVSGRPISFTMDLYQPLYVPRPQEELELYASLRPPTFEGALEAKSPPAPAAAAPARGRRDMRTRGFGGGGGGVFAGKEVEAADAEMALDDAGVASAATAQAAGELFEYVINTPVALERQHSAMLPIVTTDVEGTKLSIYNPGSHPKHPLNGLKLKNTTGLHLMQGPITVFDGNVYAGDAKLPDLRADEERLVAYALDLAVEVDAKAHPQPDDVTRLVIRKGSLIQTRRLVDDRTYTVKNKSAAARTVLIEQPYDKSWTFKEPEKPEEATPTLLRFKVEPPAKGNATLRVLLERPVDEHIVLSNLGQDQIVVYMRSRVISEAVKKALARLVELRTALDNTTRQIAQTNAEIEEVSNEQSRIRENMKTLSHNSEVYKRYEKKFDSQETEIEKRREQIAELRKTEQAQRNELEQFLLSLNVD